MCVCVSHAPCPTLCHPIDCSLLGSSVHGILQARILEWVAMPFSRGFSQPRNWIQVSCIADTLYTLVPPGKTPFFLINFKIFMYIVHLSEEPTSGFTDIMNHTIVFYYHTFYSYALSFFSYFRLLSHCFIINILKWVFFSLSYSFVQAFAYKFLITNYLSFTYGL